MEGAEIHQEPLLSRSPQSPHVFGSGAVISGGGGLGLFSWFNPSAGGGQDDDQMASPRTPRTPLSPPPPSWLTPQEPPPPTRRLALTFDGKGGCKRVPFVVGPPQRLTPRAGIPPSTAPSGEAPRTEFNWFHIEVPRTRQRLSSVAQALIESLCPPLSLQEILGIVSNGPFCGMINGHLIFRVNATGPVHSKYTLKMAVCIGDKYVVSVSLGRTPRLEFKAGHDVQNSFSNPDLSIQIEGNEALNANEPSVPPIVNGKLFLKENVLEFLLTMNHSNEADNPIPDSMAKLITHIIDTYVDQIQDLVMRVEMDLDNIERQIDLSEDYKRKLLNDHKLPKLHLSLQRILQVVSHSDMMMKTLKDKVVQKANFKPDDENTLDTLSQRLLHLKNSIGFLLSRNSALQGGLDTWQSEQINNKLYVLSVLSIIFLPLSIITGAFGMNIGGVPWVSQPDPSPYVMSGWRNVMFLCASVVLLVSTIFCLGPIWSVVSARWRQRSAMTKWKRAVELIKIRSKEQRARRDATSTSVPSISTLIHPRSRLPPP